MRERVGGARLAWVRGSLVDYVIPQGFLHTIQILL